MISVGVVAGLGLLLGLALALADKYISVPEDERVSKVQALLPGANCGSCGRAGCAAMAKALCSGEAVLTECPVMNGESREKMAQLLGTQSGESEPKAAVTAESSQLLPRILMTAQTAIIGAFIIICSPIATII